MTSPAEDLMAGGADASRAELLELMDKAWTGDYVDPTDGLLEAVCVGLLYVGDALRERGRP